MRNLICYVIRNWWRSKSGYA